MDIDWENLMFIGNKISGGIWTIPEDDLKWFNDTKKKIEDSVSLDDAFDYVVNNMSMELLDYIRQNNYEEIKEIVFEQESL